MFVALAIVCDEFFVPALGKQRRASTRKFVPVCDHNALLVCHQCKKVWQKASSWQHTSYGDDGDRGEGEKTRANSLRDCAPQQSSVASFFSFKGDDGDKKNKP